MQETCTANQYGSESSSSFSRNTEMQVQQQQAHAHAVPLVGRRVQRGRAELRVTPVHARAARNQRAQHRPRAFRRRLPHLVAVRRRVERRALLRFRVRTRRGRHWCAALLVPAPAPVEFLALPPAIKGGLAANAARDRDGAAVSADQVRHGWLVCRIRRIIRIPDRPAAACALAPFVVRARRRSPCRPAPRRTDLRARRRA